MSRVPKVLVASMGAILAVGVGSLLATGKVHPGQHKTVIKETGVPHGDWTLSAAPYMGPDFTTIPIDVTGVTLDASKGLTVTKVGLRNHSDQPVQAVKLRWWLYDEKHRDTTLLYGTTGAVALPQAISVNEKREVNFPVVSFAKIYQPLVREGTLRGDFHIEIAVVEAIYYDGSTWSKDGPNPAEQLRTTKGNSLTDIAYTGKRSSFPFVCPGTCPYQVCIFKDACSCFECGSSGTNCIFCTNEVSSCTSAICRE